MKHKAVLLIDDDEDDQLIFTDAISEIFSDVVCVVASNGREAYSKLEKSLPTPSMIFLDLNMPVMNGFEFLNQVKSDNTLKDIPIVIYTTSDNPVDKKNALEAGAVLFFTKTPDFKQLKQRLRDILKSDL